MKGLSEALKGTNGGYELTRVLGGAGGFVYILGANAFVAWEIALGRGFDLATYCLAFPGGLAAIIAAVSGGAAWKDKGVASAKVIEQTGAVPAAPPAGPRVPVEEKP
jgi:uncharacterized iron-regulated membrane protein